MNNKQLEIANIENLTQLWEHMGATPCLVGGATTCWMSVSWPNRCWFAPAPLVEEISSFVRYLNQANENVIVPIWGGLGGFADQLEPQLTGSGFKVVSEQTAMYLDLDNYSIEERSGLDVRPIHSAQDIGIWTRIAAQSFDYEIDRSVIERLAVNPDVYLFTAYVADRPAATAMLFRTGDVIGVHQVGVLSEYRGKGIARGLMRDVISLCIQMPARYITLQASMAGEHLYRSLHFNRQFGIKNYQRTTQAT